MENNIPPNKKKADKWLKDFGSGIKKIKLPEIDWDAEYYSLFEGALK